MYASQCSGEAAGGEFNLTPLPLHALFQVLSQSLHQLHVDSVLFRADRAD